MLIMIIFQCRVVAYAFFANKEFLSIFRIPIQPFDHLKKFIPIIFSNDS